MTFSTADIPSLKGKVAIVTGANTGIGRPTSLELARKGAHVFMACRNKEKSMPVIEEITKELAATNSEGKVEYLQLDLASLKSVKAAATEFLSKSLPLHLLINNAGIMALPKFETTEDGFEKQWGTNHLGHFYFTTLLMDVIEKSAPARIVCLSSMAHEMAGKKNMVMSQLGDPAYYNDWVTYGISKASNLMFAIELSRRLNAKGVKNIWVNAVHPGVVKTELMRNMGGVFGFLMPVLYPIVGLFLLSPEQGALTQLYAATHPDIETNNWHGQYFVPIAKHKEPKDYVKNEQLAKELWEFSEKCIKDKMGV